MRKDLPIILWLIWVLALSIGYLNQLNFIQWGWTDNFKLKVQASTIPRPDVKIYQWNQLKQERIE